MIIPSRNPKASLWWWILPTKMLPFAMIETQEPVISTIERGWNSYHKATCGAKSQWKHECAHSEHSVQCFVIFFEPTALRSRFKVIIIPIITITNHHHHPQDIYPISFPSTMDPHGVEAHPLGHLDVNLPAEPTLATNARHRHVANALDGGPQLDGSHSSRCRPAAGRKAGHRDHDRSWCNIYIYFLYIYIWNMAQPSVFSCMFLWI